MRRPLGDLEHFADVVEAEAGPECPEVAWADREGGGRVPIPAATRESEPQALVDDLLERLARAPDLGLEPVGHVLVEGQGGAHILMLHIEHHDVNEHGTTDTAPAARV